MKKGKNLITLIAILMVIIIAYALMLITNKSKEEEETDIPDDNVSIYQVNKDTISKIQINNEHGEIIISKNADMWVYEKDNEIPINQDNISSMLTAISDIKGTIVVENSDNLDEYGLKNSPVKVIATLDTGEAISFNIGNEAPMGGSYYFNKQDDSTVYLIDVSTSANFNYKLSDLAVMPTIPEISIDYLVYLLVQNKGNDFEVSYKTGGDEADISGYYEWFITKAYDNTVVADFELLTPLLNEMIGITFKECIEYKCSDFTPYGLAEVETDVTFGYYEETEEGSGQYEYKAFKLYIGNVDEESGDYYVRMSGSYSVNLMSAELVNKILNISAFDYVLKLIDLINIDTVDKLVIELNGNVYEMKITREIIKNEDGEEETESTYYFDGRKVEESNFKALYTSIISLKAIGEIDPEKESSGEETLKFTFHRNTNINSKVLVSCISYDATFNKININGTEIFLINKRAVSELAKAIESFE